MLYFPCEKNESGDKEKKEKMLGKEDFVDVRG